MRRIVFPSLRLLVWAVIAVALVRIAFAGADLSAEADPLQPGGQLVEPTVEVTTGTVVNTVDVAGSVVADPAVPVKATAAGTVSKLLVGTGQAVDKDATLLEIRTETPQDPVVSFDEATGVETIQERAPKVTVTAVKAPVAGTVTLPTLVGQEVTIGDEVASLAPGTLSITATLTPEQQYRLLNPPTEAQVTLRGGPAPFTCTGMRIGAAAAGAGGGAGGGVDPGTGLPAETASGTVSCAVPAGVTAFAGLGADVSITNGQAEGPVVPVTAVQGSVQSGNVWVVTPELPEGEMRQVGLGLTDGENVQVTSGLEVGEQVLQFIPVADDATNCADPAQYDPAVCG
ncbi:secretion protein HlyD [Cellulomonas endophytica]|uniref:secretion protein HlyD n=1 Tax=Cellulomonas endophytica TaxID=2494735 RepID=UPI001F0C249A|nr:secretion protein HlyD [Cellulomonas endophytica]